MLVGYACQPPHKEAKFQSAMCVFAAKRKRDKALTRVSSGEQAKLGWRKAKEKSEEELTQSAGASAEKICTFLLSFW